MNVVRDRIARRAAALVAAGAPDVDAAIHQAAHQLGFTRGAPLPTAGEVRRHLQGMAQESLGDVGYRAWVAEHHALAAHVMDLLERAFAGPTLLAGRAARGQFDGGASAAVAGGALPLPCAGRKHGSDRADVRTTAAVTA